MPRSGRDAPLECKVYVGDLGRDTSEKELQTAFGYYGSLKSVWVARNPPGFAFVEFDDVRDADDAVRAMDGTSLCGSRIRVEQSTGKSGPKPWTSSGRRSRERDVGGRGGPARPRKPYDPNDRCYECGGRGHYAYDCQRYGGGNSHRSRSRSVDRRKDRSRSHSRGRYYRSRSRSRSRDRYKRSRSPSRSLPPRDRNRSRSRSVSRPRYR